MATRVDEAFVLQRCSYFATVGLWPTPGDGLDPKAWLSNFEPGEQHHALYLLNAYLFFSDRIVDRLFVEAFQSLSRIVGDPCDHGNIVRDRWRAFFEDAIVVPVQGEVPSLADSGLLFARRARNLLGIPEARLLQPAAAINRIQAGTDVRVVFVDDFVGTGAQFVATWHRKEATSAASRSFADLAAAGLGSYYYCPVIATAYGAKVVAQRCPEVSVNPGHLLPPRYSAVATDSLIWPESLRASAEQFLQLASERAGIPINPGATRYWKGYRSLGLTVSFEHGTPDATLPLFDWDQNGWYPLWGRG
jgi:hypothetical protein